MRRFSANWLALLAATAIALYLCWLIVQPFVMVILWAAVLAIISNPLYRWLRRRHRGPNTSALITTLVVVLAVVIPLTLLAAGMLSQAKGAADGLQSAARDLLDPESNAYQFVNRYINLDQLRDREFLADKIKTFTTTIAGHTLGVVGGIVGSLLHMIFVLFTLFYLLRDSDSIVPALRDTMPLDQYEADLVIRRTQEVISASIYGIIVIAAVQGVLGGFAFWVLRLPSPLLWGVAMFLMSMVPMVGCAVIWAPAALYLMATGSWGKAIFLILWGTLVIGIVDNFLRPRLVGGRTKLHELVVFFSVLGGLQVFGILGLIVGPVLVAITLSLVDVMRRMNRPRTELAPVAATLRPTSLEPAPPTQLLGTEQTQPVPSPEHSAPK
jgi:predicted PurR-regulated permease PerM